MATEDQSHREVFEEFLTETYVEGDHKKSKTVTNTKAETIIEILNNPTKRCCPKLKHWIKQRGFSLMNYGPLGLKNVLCLPLPASKEAGQAYIWL